jgi:hypothetical protein
MRTGVTMIIGEVRFESCNKDSLLNVLLAPGCKVVER